MNEFFRKAGIRNAIAIVVVVGCFLLLYFLLFHPMPPGNKDVLNIAVGSVLSGGLAQVVGYYFGSSKNESDKNKT